MSRKPPGNPEERLGPAHRGVHDGAETFSGSTLVDELQDLLCDGQSGRWAEGGQLLFILLLRLKTQTRYQDPSQPG